MNKTSTSRKISFAILFASLSFNQMYAQAVVEGFDDISVTTTTNGWSIQNLSNPVGTTTWSQGAGVGAPAYSGAADSYAEAGYTATDPAGSGTISDWLIGPEYTFNNGDTISFWALSYNSGTYPDRLELRLSLAGASTNVGATEFEYGDFNVLLTTVNPYLDTANFPDVAVHANSWYKYIGIVSGLAAPTSGRFAFRYFVLDGGGTGSNSSTVGIDEVTYNPNTLTVPPCSETFEDLSILLGTGGWAAQNLSNPVGTVSWQQGPGGLGATANSGTASSYIADDYQATDPSGSGTISDWIISDTNTFNNGDLVTFYALSYNSFTYPDRVELRLSVNGSSTNVGLNETEVGDFSILLATVNPYLDSLDFPSIANQGQSWQIYGGYINGLAGPTQGRVAIRYYVPDGGGAGSNSSSIGIDDISITPCVITGINQTPVADVRVNIYPNPAMDEIMIDLGTFANENSIVKIYNSMGQEVRNIQINKGDRQLSVDMRNFNAGLYQVLISDKNNSYGKEIVKE